MQRTRSVLKTETEEKEGRKCKGRSREKVSTSWEDDVKSCKTSISHANATATARQLPDFQLFSSTPVNMVFAHYRLALFLPNLPPDLEIDRCRRKIIR